MGKVTTFIKHLSLNIEGAFRNFGRRKMTGLLQDDDGTNLSDKEVRDYLNECLVKGWKVIPCGDCDNFDYQTGCKGHTKKYRSNKKKKA